jgi:hypothetical protein
MGTFRANRYRTRKPLVGEICEVAVSIITADFTLPGSARCLGRVTDEVLLGGTGFSPT